MFQFYFTKKKFLKLSHQKQHKVLRDWLMKLLESQHVIIDFQFLQNYILPEYFRVINWIKLDQQIEENLHQTPLQKIQNQIHYHNQFLNDFSTEYPMQNIKSDLDISQYQGAQFQWQVLLDNIRSAYNVGSIIRTVDGAGWEKVLATGITAPLDHVKVKKASMGAYQWITTQRINNLKQFLTTNKLKIYALERDKNKQKNYFDVNWEESGIVVLGHEVNGINKLLLDAADEIVSIPMHGLKNSLNVSNAFSILAYHINQHLQTHPK